MCVLFSKSAAFVGDVLVGCAFFCMRRVLNW